MFVAIVSADSVDKSGWPRAELKLAIDLSKKRPSGEAYLVPILVDRKARIPSDLADARYIDASGPGGLERAAKELVRIREER